MSEGAPNTQEPQTPKQESRTHSPEQIPLSEQLHGLIEYANLSPEELRKELLSMVERFRNFEEVSRTDVLTGLLDRGGFYEQAHEFEALFARERETRNIEIPSALLVIDLDGFKEVNDAMGHAGGDECLKRIAEKVKAALRESDIFARTGGDEFAIFLPDSDEESAILVAQKIRVVIEEVGKELHESVSAYSGGLSASVGIVDSSGNLPFEERLKQADYAAYVVKASGKKGEFTLKLAREADADGGFERDFLAEKALPR